MERDSGKESGRDSAGSSCIDDDLRNDQQPLRKDTPGPMPQYQYSREKLQDIQETEESKKRPNYLSSLYDNTESIWDPEKWCKSFTPEGREGSPITLSEIRDRKRPSDLERDIPKRKLTADPKERLKEEQDGIVLSPQRRSFGTGCHVTQTSSLVRQSSTTSDYNDDRERNDRNSRRIGSGRIQIDRDQGRDYRGRFDRDEREDNHDDRNNRRFERSDRFRRDFDDRRDYRDSRGNERVERDRGSELREARERDPRNVRSRDLRESQHRDYNSRDRDQHRYSSNRRTHHQEEEPEWFTAGPTSQSDTIELKGFEKDNEKENVAKLGPDHDKDKGRVKSRSKDEEPKKKRDKKSPSVEKKVENKDGKENGPSVSDRNGSLETNESSSSEAGETRPSPTTASLFDFNQFFSGGIPGLNDDVKIEKDSGSRFSQWFSKGSKDNSRRSSINEEFHFEYLDDMLKDSKSPVSIIPSPTPPPIPNVFDKPYNHYYNMEDKVVSSLETALHHKNIVSNQQAFNQMMMANTTNRHHNNQGTFSSQDAEAHLKAMLFGRKEGSSTPDDNIKAMIFGRKDSASSSGTASPSGGTRLKTVAELEAGFHQNSPSSSTRMSPINQTNRNEDGDLTAFNKLLSLMTGAANSSPSPPTLPMLDNPAHHHQLSQALPQISSQTMNNTKFMEAMMKNREQQMNLQQQVMNQMRMTTTGPPQPSPLTLSHHMMSQQHSLAGPRPDQRLMSNHMQTQQNPTIITKPPSPAVGPIPPLVQSTSTPRIGPTTSPMTVNNLLPKQHPQQPSVPRIPSPIMFSQQPPMHLNAPSPIHPTQLGRPAPNNTLSTSPTMINRVPSPQELIAHNQAILQSALIKKQLEDQKERFLKKQQDRAKSPNTATTQNKSPSVSSSSSNTQGSGNNKTTMSPAFTPTSVMRKMHSDKASEKEKGKPDGDDSLCKAPIKRIVGDGGQGDHTSIDKDDHINDNINNMVQEMTNMSVNGKKGLRPLVANSQNIQPTIGQQQQQQQSNNNQQTSTGRPIFKSFSTPQPNHQQQSAPLNHQTPQVRPVTGNMSQSAPTGHRPITGNGGDLNKILPQQVRLPTANPMPRPGLNSNPAFGLHLPGRMPLQSNVLGGQVHPAAANALLVQQVIQNNTNPAARVNVMNQLNQINQLAALQAQQRMIDPRVQAGIRASMYPPVPQMLNPRSNAPTNVAMVSPTTAGMGRAVSPAKILPLSQKQNGPLSPNMGNIIHGNNNSSPDTNIFNKLFSNSMIKSQLNNMPALPVQGQRVMTVDEIERN